MLYNKSYTEIIYIKYYFNSELLAIMMNYKSLDEGHFYENQKEKYRFISHTNSSSITIYCDYIYMCVSSIW